MSKNTKKVTPVESIQAEAMRKYVRLVDELLEAMDGMDCADYPGVPVAAALLRQDTDRWMDYLGDGA
jgi:hypothetical protein